MKNLTSFETRRQFIQFFEQRGHSFVPSSRVVPEDDPTLLFTNAGMNQFKDVFLGIGKREYTRAVNSQKCMRVAGKHNDLEEVGRDGYHHTYFEMLGNWSFGDYYKREAIQWAWELLTGVYGLPKEKIWVTVYFKDQESRLLWSEISGLPPERILDFKEKDNFWEMGEVGPCGPCTEIHFDRGEGLNTGDPLLDCVNGGGARYIEIWNLVFMEFERVAGGALIPLKARHVDTGMGFERICSILQEKTSNYETDIFWPLIEKLEEMSGKNYHPGSSGTPFRVICDHIRSLCFTLADGAMPSNEGQGYVIRRILRRAVRFGRELGFNTPFFFQLVPTLVQLYGDFFGELKEKRSHIESVIHSEEERFFHTLESGLKILEDQLAELSAQKINLFPGEKAFKLYDTFGFPLDLTALICQERGFGLDTQEFENEMEKQRTRAREAGGFKMDFGALKIPEGCPVTEFTGYDHLNEKSTLLNILQQGENTFLIFNRTPFYAEKGGQAGDKGVVLNPEGVAFEVEDTLEKDGVILHRLNRLPISKESAAASAPLQESQMGEWELRVHPLQRRLTARNHSATHLLHSALKKILGPHVEQAGSLVDSTRLRFDFSHPKGLSESERSQIENLVNSQIGESVTTQTTLTDIETARKSGAIAIFGEKYGESVRMVTMGAFSTELCGGTHVPNTSEIGLFKIISESSIAANVRRIEGKTSVGAFEYLEWFREKVGKICDLTKCPPDNLAPRIEGLLKENRDLEKEVKKLKRAMFQFKVPEMLQKRLVDSGFGFPFFGEQLADLTVDELKELSRQILDKLGEGMVVLASNQGGEHGQLIVLCSPTVIKKGFPAGSVVKSFAKRAGGSGGGRPEMAMAGYKETSQFPTLFEKASEILVDISHDVKK